VADDPALIDDNPRFKALVAKIHTRGKRASRLNARAQERQTDRALRMTSTVASAQIGPAVALPAPETGHGRELIRPVPCYICKASFTSVHHFYHMLCPDCAAINFAKRTQRANLHGRTALVTGGRIKIGFQIVLNLLRDGARVIVTTRFPVDAARRFDAEPDAYEWRYRLEVHALDLRNLPSVEEFAAGLVDREPALDIVINNAAQTVKRPLAYYRELLEGEFLPSGRTELARRAEPVLLEARDGYPGFDSPAEYFPSGLTDVDGQPLDLRPENSWRLRLGEVGTVEMVETMLVNAAAPFILNSRLKPLLISSSHVRRFVVNVSAMEGQFGRETKTPNHPHTNMAKAALNMMTRTSAQDYRQDGIYMTSVDTGWITDENPFETKCGIRERHGFFTPLDVIDGAARVYDPVVRGVNDDCEPDFGVFLKDYAPYAW